MSTPSARFAERYRAHVQPRIARAIKVAALFIALGERSLALEYDRIVLRAWQLGGSHMPEKLWTELEAWIETQLFEAAIGADDEIGAYRRSVAVTHAEAAAWDRRVRETFPA